MGHHFVPQFYLRGFTEGNTIWVYDRLGSCSFNSQPKTVANENKMYTEEIESWLTNEIEGHAHAASLIHEFAHRLLGRLGGFFHRMLHHGAFRLGGGDHNTAERGARCSSGCTR